MKEGFLLICLVLFSLLFVVPRVIDVVSTIWATGMKIPLRNILIRGVIFLVCVLTACLFIYFDLHFNLPVLGNIAYFLILIGGSQLYFIGIGEWIDKAKKRWKRKY